MSTKYFSVCVLSLMTALSTVGWAKACECIEETTINRRVGEPVKQFYKRQMEDMIAKSEIAVSGYFARNDIHYGVDTLSGKFQVKNVIKGTAAKSILVFTKTKTNCGAPWIFREGLLRDDMMTLSLRRRSLGGALSYEVGACSVAFFPADIE